METQKKQIVLIVDDSLLICEQIKAALKDTPIFICEAHNGQEAVAYGGKLPAGFAYC